MIFDRFTGRIGRLLLRCCVLLVAGASSGCSPLGIINALTPGSGYRIVQNVAYGPEARQGLDIYVPLEARDAPVIVFFYGGNWEQGSKDDYRFVGQAFVSHGYIAVIPDYRLYPGVRYPAFLQDGAAAVRWVHDNISVHGGASGPLFLGGHSAGAYNAAMLGLDKRWLGAVGLDPDRDLRGVIGLAGPYDFLPIKDPVLKIVFGPPDEWPATQPIRYAHKGAPPFFLASGSADTTVDPGNATRLADRLKEDGGSVDIKFYEGISHRELVGSLAAPLRFLDPALKDAVAFMKRVSPPLIPAP